MFGRLETVYDLYIKVILTQRNKVTVQPPPLNPGAGNEKSIGYVRIKPKSQRGAERLQDRKQVLS